MNDMNRTTMMEEILHDLELLRSSPGVNQYALEENIIFFKNCRSLPLFLSWLLRRAPKIDKNKLLELTDFQLARWELVMHDKLIEMEKKSFPGLIKPLVDRMTALIKAAQRPMTIVNFGGGGGEVERQIINNLISLKFNHRVAFVSIDRSAIAEKLIRDNLDKLKDHLSLHAAKSPLDGHLLDKLKASEAKQYIMVHCKNDIFRLERNFKPKAFDIAFHSLFKHHLDAAEQRSLDVIIRNLAQICIEYDGFLSWHNMIPQTIVGWSNPVFLNAEIFSHLRFATKKELKAIHDTKKISFSRIGYYLCEG